MARSHICGTEKSSVISLWHWGCEVSSTLTLQQHPLGHEGEEVEPSGGKKASEKLLDNHGKAHTELQRDPFGVKAIVSTRPPVETASGNLEQKS